MKKMKLTTLINKLEKARDDFKAKHGIEPVIWCIDSDEGEMSLTDTVIKVPMGHSTGSKNERYKIPAFNN